MRLCNFYFIIINIILLLKNVRPVEFEDVFEHFDDLYSKLLNLPSESMERMLIDEQLDKNLKTNLEFCILYANIKNIMTSIKVTENEQKIIEKEQKAFEELFSAISSFSKISQYETCILWQFWRGLGKFFVENKMMQNDEMERFIKLYKKIDINEIDCHKIAENVFQNVPLTDEKNATNVFLNDLRQLHFNAILFLLDRKNEVGKAPEIGQVGQYKLWEFSKFFNDTKIENETNFSYQFRILRIKEDTQSVVLLKKLKWKIKELIGPIYLSILEVLRPIELQIDTIFDEEYATEYAMILSTDRQIAKQAEFRLSIRIYFSKIWNKILDAKISKNEMEKCRIVHFWDGGELVQMTQTFIHYEEKETFEKIFEFSAKIGEKNEKEKGIENKSGKLKKKASKKGKSRICDDILDKVRSNLLDTHSELMANLSGETNAFSKLLKNSLETEKGALAKLCDFYSAKNLIGNDNKKCSPNSVEVMAKMEQKYPKLTQMLRNKLTDEQIKKLQNRNYLKYLNEKSEQIEWTRAKFMMDILAHYQIFKNQLNDPNNLSFQTELIDQNMGTMELSMDSISVINSVKEIEQLQGNLITQLKNSSNLFPELKHSLAKGHVEILKKLCAEKEFQNQLREIQIDKERMCNLLGRNEELLECDKSSMSKERSDGNEENGTTEQQKGAKGAQMGERKVGKKAWETDLDLEEGSALTFAYNKIFFVKNCTISNTVKQSFLIKAAHLQFKLWVQRLLEVLDLLKDKNNPKFTRMAIKLGIEATEMGFFERGGGANGREVQLCQMISFIVHLMDNGTLRENDEWAIFIEGFGRETDFLSAINEKVQLIKHDNNLWVKKKCEEPRIGQMIISHLKSPTTQGQIHMRVVHVLFTHFHDFLKHVALNGINFTKIIDYDGIGQKELLEFYIKHLIESNNFDEASLEDEDKIAVLIKLLSLCSSRKENKVIKNIEIGKELLKSGEQNSEIDKFTMIIRDNYVAKAETCVLLKLIEIFAGKSAPIRMLCPLMHFIDFLEKQLSNEHQFWQFPRKCFQMEISEINRNQMKVLGAEHFNYLAAFIENAKEKDELLQILREKHGALYRMRLLVGGKNAIQRMWEMPKIRNKLLNRNFFTNKLHLLNHYRRFLLLDDQFAPNASEMRLAERFGADVFVWMNWLEMDRHNQCTKVQKLMDDLHLYFRLLYDAYCIAAEMEDAMRIFSFALPAIKTFVDESRNKMLNLTEINKEWGKLSRLIKKVADNAQNVVAQTEEERKKYEEPIPIIQKLHFAEFMELLNRKEEEDGSEKEELERMLEDELNKNNQQKMSDFLTENDLKRFYEAIENKKTILNGNEKGQNENNEKKKAKKEEKKRRKKEKKKTKKEEENNKLNEKMEKKQINGENEGENGQFGQKEKKEKQNSNEKNCKESGKSLGGKAVEKRRDITEYNARRKLIKHNLAEELAKIHSINDFYNDAFLYAKYEEFVAKPSIEMQRIIDVGAFLNEIGHRLKAMGELERFNHTGNPQKSMGQLRNEWDTFLEQFGKLEVPKLEKMEKKVSKFMQLFLNNLQNTKQFEPDEITKQIKVQIHLKNLSMALLKNNEFNEKWKNYENKTKKEKLFYLLGERFGAERFEKVKFEWKRMAEQTELDISLYRKHLSKDQQNEHIFPAFPYISQQTFLGDHKMKENLQKYLFENIGKNSSADGTEINGPIWDGLSQIHRIVEEWSNGAAQLYISGSFLLGTRTFSSDIDLICIAPGKIIKLANFFGEENVFCKKNECTTEQNDSLFCKFCQNKGVKNLIKTPFGKVFLIRFLLNGIDFDLTFVSIPAKRILPFVLSDDQIGKYINNFKSERNFAHKNMLRALSSYRSIFYLANLFQENHANCAIPLSGNKFKVEKFQNKKAKKFQALVLFMKIWAKENHIYSTAYGFLNGPMLAIMAAKVILLYPSASLPFLIERFFIFYLLRPIRVPVQLAKLKLEENFDVNENWDLFFVRKPDEQEMPVYTPMFPEQNVAWHLTHSAARVIRREMKIALNKIKVMNEENLYELLTKATPFTEKYKTFILVNCASEQIENGEYFCRFVSGRIRLQIVFDIDQKGNGKTETQLYNGIYQEKCTLYESSFSQNALSFRPNFCIFWLIGIQSYESRENMRKNLKNFDLKIKSDFVKYNHKDKDGKRRIDFHRINAEEIAEKFKELKMELKSTVEDREQLERLNSKDNH